MLEFLLFHTLAMHPLFKLSLLLHIYKEVIRQVHWKNKYKVPNIEILNKKVAAFTIPSHILYHEIDDGHPEAYDQNVTLQESILVMVMVQTLCSSVSSHRCGDLFSHKVCLHCQDELFVFSSLPSQQYF